MYYRQSNMGGITLVWSFRNRFEVLRKSLETADKFFPKSIIFCLVDASSDEKTIRNLRELANTLNNRTVRICESSYRSSLSEAWNLGLMLSDSRFVIFSSSDVEFKSDKLFDEISKVINAGFEYVLVENHAVFMLDKAVIPKIGWFDEKYSIGPHFDTDYMIRASENHARFLIIPNNGYYFHSDPPKLASMRRKREIKDRLPMHDLSNEKYFKKKWKSSWKGWKFGHPPSDIKLVKRQFKEEDPHPLFTKRFKKIYKESKMSSLRKGFKRLPIKVSQRLQK